MPQKTKEARKLYGRLYLRKHRETINARRRASRPGKYLRNRDRELAYYRNRRQTNRDQVLAREAAYRDDHRATLNRQARERYALHQEAERAKKRSRYCANKKAMNEYQSAYVRRNRERDKLLIAARYRRYRQSHPHKVQAYAALRRARKAAAVSDSTAEVFYAFIRSRRSIPCYYCGVMVKGKEAHIDHVIALSKSGNHTSQNLCASCPKCNLSKHNQSLTEWRPATNQPLLNF